jgi:signal transduction histidine kinase
MDETFAQLQPDEHSTLQLLRIVQEALSNAIKHSRATELRVRFEADPRHLRIIVADNGSGFNGGGLSRVGLSGGGLAGEAVGSPARETTGDPSAPQATPGLGIAGLRKRAYALGGDVAIDTSARGTTVVVSVPLESVASVSSAALVSSAASAASGSFRAPPFVPAPTTAADVTAAAPRLPASRNPDASAGRSRQT